MRGKKRERSEFSIAPRYSARVYIHVDIALTFENRVRRDVDVGRRRDAATYSGVPNVWW